MTTSRVPELVPLLSRGKHRNPRKGACFMELASFMAGERWSDHPACTHPLLASLARLVNDFTTDAGRPRLVPLIPSVIGLTSDDPHLDVRIALRSATAALPVAAAERQRVLAVAVIVANRLLDDLDQGAGHDLEERGRLALAEAPDAARWAERFTERSSTSAAAFRRHGAPVVVRHAVEGIASACIPDPDAMLHDVLRTTIEDCAAWIHPQRTFEVLKTDVVSH
ncbi:MAG: hypothetical protein AB7Q42_01385 [Acidimicrobiia bacterium]